MANSYGLTVSIVRSLWSVAVITSCLPNAALADNSYAANNKGYSGTSYARSSKVQNAGQTMYSNSQTGSSPGTSYAGGSSYSGTSYARNSAGVPSSHINSSFSASTGSGASSNRASMLSVMGRGGGAVNAAKPIFVRPASSFGNAGVRRPQPGTASATQGSRSGGAGSASAAAANSSASPSGISVLSRMRKRRG